MEAGPDGMLSFQPGNALMQNANGSIRNNPSITEKDSSLYQKGGGGVPLSFGGSNLNQMMADANIMDEKETRGSLNI